jgi:hypothetical protein
LVLRPLTFELAVREGLFFSEEKNQKTFNSAPAYRSMPWPDSWEATEK